MSNDDPRLFRKIERLWGKGKLSTLVLAGIELTD